MQGRAGGSRPTSGETGAAVSGAPIDHQGWALTAHPATTDGTRQPVDLLFVHGMAAGGWIWSDAFLAPFRAAGFGCWTVTLPGRRAGPTRARDAAALSRRLELRLDLSDPQATLAGLSEALSEALSDTVPGAALADGPDLAALTEALAQALAATGRPTVLVCHSLGGALGQNLLRQGRGGAGLVLLCSVPPYGLWRASAEMAVTNPALWLALARFSLAGHDPADAEVMRRNLFPAGIAAGAFERFTAQLRDESLAATLQCLGLPPFAPLPGPRREVLVAGTRSDRMVPPVDLLATAAWYGAAPVTLAASGHLPMLGPEAARAGAELAARVAAHLDVAAMPDAAAG